MILYLCFGCCLYKKRVLAQNKSKFIIDECFPKHINIKTQLKQVFTKVINLNKLGGLGGEACSSN